MYHVRRGDGPFTTIVLFTRVFPIYYYYYVYTYFYYIRFFFFFRFRSHPISFPTAPPPRSARRSTTRTSVSGIIQARSRYRYTRRSQQQYVAQQQHIIRSHCAAAARWCTEIRITGGNNEFVLHTPTYANVCAYVRAHNNTRNTGGGRDTGGWQPVEEGIPRADTKSGTSRCRCGRARTRRARRPTAFPSRRSSQPRRLRCPLYTTGHTDWPDHIPFRRREACASASRSAPQSAGT
jgi:hypothetical protein